MSKEEWVMSTDNERYEKAKKRVEEIKEFYTHLTIYICVIVGLGIINLMTTSFPWVIFPMVGWGMGVLGHWFSVFGSSVFLGKDWEERKIRELMGEEETPHKRKNVLAHDDYFEEQDIEDATQRMTNR